MKNNRLIVFFSLVVLVIVVYWVIAAQHREDLGQLEVFSYNPASTYCNYIITSFSEDAGFYKTGDKVCLVCAGSFPKVKNICPSRIKFTSASGLIEYTADLDQNSGKLCTACPMAKGYYKKP